MAERVPPHHLDAEEALLGSLFLSSDAIDAADGLDPSAFYRPQHGTLYAAIRGLVADGQPVDVVTVAAAWPDCDEAGGKRYLLDLAGRVPASANVAGYRDIVAEDARQRRLIALAGEIAERAYQGDAPSSATLTRVQELATAPTAEDRYRPGGTWVFDETEAMPAVWGRDEEILWAQGEPFYIVGPPGVGKTTLTQQLVAARCGLRDDVLGLPVDLGERTLYLACDRPKQIQRAFRRVFTAEQIDTLDETLTLWEGPPPSDFAVAPETLYQMARAAEATTVIIDSIKDVVKDINEPAQGQAFNRAVQLCVANGIEVLGLHHTRKRQPGTKFGIDDVYGGWFAAGAGSVVMLVGEPGDAVVDFLHLKQPMEQVGPWQIVHDHARGESRVERGPIDVVTVLGGHAGGRTAAQLAQLDSEGADPSANVVRKMERRCEGLVKKGKVRRIEEDPARYVVAAPD